MKGKKIVVFNQDNWTFKDNDKFKSRDYTTMIAKGIKEGVISCSEGSKLLEEYHRLRSMFKLPPHWTIEPSNGEYVLSLDRSNMPNKTWYSRDKEGLINIAFERECKEENK